jgi:hypothetical protein
MTIALSMLGATAAVDTPRLQRQLDYMVAICRAEKVVRLVAHEGGMVSIEMMKPGRLPTVSENSAFQCALKKLKQRPDLHIGFTGNEAEPKVQTR